MHTRKCNEVLVDDYGDIAESSGEESERATEELSSTNLQEIGASSILLPNSSLSETEPSDNQAAVGASILTPSGSCQLSSDNQDSDGGFLKSSEASLLQMCLEKSQETSLLSKTAPS